VIGERDPARRPEAMALATASSLGPLSRVAAALEHGATSRADLARLTGLDPDVVDGALDHLIRTGHIEATQLGGGCPAGGCGGCPSGRADGTAGCGASDPSTARGPIALRLRRGAPPSRGVS